MNNPMPTNTTVLTESSKFLVSKDANRGGKLHTKYLDKEYIVRAREAEVKQHLHSIGQLQKKMEKLASEVAWELKQHHSKIHELYQLEAPFRKNQKDTESKNHTERKNPARGKAKRPLHFPLVEKAVCESVA